MKKSLKQPIIEAAKVFSTNILSAILCGWWIADLAGSSLSFSSMLNHFSTYVLGVYALVIISLSTLSFKKGRDEARKQKFRDEILEAAVDRARRNIEMGEYATLKDIEALLGDNKE